MDFSVPADRRVKIKEGEKRDKYLDVAREIKIKAVKHEGDGDTDYNWSTWKGPTLLGEKPGGIGNQRKNRDHSDYSIVKIGQNTEKSPGDLRRFAVTQTLVKSHQLALLLKKKSQGV